ncbi:MAG: hypothetical protein AAF941_06300 [Pseudomonadota bacterium]
MLRLLGALLLWTGLVAMAPAESDPKNFIYVGPDQLEEQVDKLRRDDVEGAQVIYNWRMLEPKEGEYDFSSIETDLKLLEELNLPLFVQVQDRFFSPKARRLPQYILDNPEYDGGLVRQFDNAGEGKPIGKGWFAKQWNPALRRRFQALLKALAERFDGRIFGINLPESAISPIEGEEGFSCDAYFEATLENMRYAKAAFSKTQVVQYINFWPCEWNNDKGYMERSFALAVEQGIGVGGPDIIPNRRGQMKNSYPFFNRHKQDLPLIAMGIQEPTLTYTDPETGKPFARSKFVEFARDYLGVDIIFWSVEAPWLNAPREAAVL